MNPEGLYEWVEESLSRPTHRKWMWGGPGKTVHCVSTETIAIQQNPVAAFMFMFRAVSFSLGIKNIQLDVCEWSQQADIFFLN